MLPIHIDTNVPIYAFGRRHSLQQPCRRIIRLIGANTSAFSTDAAVFQELLHRYLALRMWPDYRDRHFGFMRLMADRTESILPGDVGQAARLADAYPQLSARDLIHVAVMKRVSATRIVSADRGFDAVADIERLDPADVGRWRSLLA